MSIDWDAELLQPLMSLFGEGQPADQSMWPIYTPAGGTAFALADAVFDRQSGEIEPEEGIISATTIRRPVLGVRLALFATYPDAPAQGDSVFIPSVGMTFLVSNSLEDGHGWSKLVLMVAQA